MTRQIVDIDYTRCTGCRACVLTCSVFHAGVVRPSASAIHIASSLDEGVNVPLLCIACKERPCLDVCPVNAIRLHKTLGIPLIDTEACTGCQSCIPACPYHGISFDPVADKAVKCDLCDGEPLCVKVCMGAYEMPGALHYVTLSGEEEADYDRRVQERMNVYRSVKDGSECS